LYGGPTDLANGIATIGFGGVPFCVQAFPESPHGTLEYRTSIIRLKAEQII